MTKNSLNLPNRMIAELHKQLNSYFNTGQSICTGNL